MLDRIYLWFIHRRDSLEYMHTVFKKELYKDDKIMLVVLVILYTLAVIGSVKLVDRILDGIFYKKLYDKIDYDPLTDYDI